MRRTYEGIGIYVYNKCSILSFESKFKYKDELEFELETYIRKNRYV
jgi:hypothetical protein